MTAYEPLLWKWGVNTVLLCSVPVNTWCVWFPHHYVQITQKPLKHDGALSSCMVSCHAPTLRPTGDWWVSGSSVATILCNTVTRQGPLYLFIPIESILVNAFNGFPCVSEFIPLTCFWERNRICTCSVTVPKPDKWVIEFEKNDYPVQYFQKCFLKMTLAFVTEAGTHLIPHIFFKASTQMSGDLLSVSRYHLSFIDVFAFKEPVCPVKWSWAAALQAFWIVISCCFFSFDFFIFKNKKPTQGMDQCCSHKTDNPGTSLKWNLLAFCYEQPVFHKNS